VLGNQEIVVKNIGPQLARVIGVDGATVLGNGQVVLILNPIASPAATDWRLPSRRYRPYARRGRPRAAPPACRR
jgi:hypothetical protein